MRRVSLWKLGGAVCSQPEVLDQLAKRYRRSKPAWIVMHGAGPQLDAALRLVDGEPRKIAGLRVTSAAGAEVVCRVMDEVGAELTLLLRQRGVPAVHVPASSRWMQGAVKVVVGGDLGSVGTPTSVDTAAIQAILAAGEVPVVSPTAFDAVGPLNVNADEAAAALGGALRCHTMHLITDVPHVRARNGPVTQLSQDAAHELIMAGDAQGGMIPKLEAACAAIDAGVQQVRIGDVLTILAGGGTLLLPTVEVAA